MRDRLQRRVVPRLIVAVSGLDVRGRLARLQRSGTVRLFVAFDDPSSAVALLGLARRVEGRRVRLVVEPVVARGIPGDPAVEDKRRYAVVDARRLGRRDGLELARTAPVDPQETAFLAAWAAQAPPDRRTAFCVAAMRAVWVEDALDADRLWRETVGGDPPQSGSSARAERAFRRHRLYDTPVAVVHGQWFFAHERLDQIVARLDHLGWSAA